MAITPLPALAAISLLQNLDRRDDLLRRLPLAHRDICGQGQLHDGAI